MPYAIRISPGAYGRGLLLHAYYNRWLQSLVYDDLITGSSRKIFTVPEHTSVQLPAGRMSTQLPYAPTTLCA